jgi:uncharacterized Zn finger protein
VTAEWIYLDMTSNTGKILYACSACGHVTPAPTKTHQCNASGLEMNQRKPGALLPESAFEQ